MLVPRRDSASIGKLRLTVARDTYDIRGAEVHDPLGNISRLRFEHLRRNVGRRRRPVRISGAAGRRRDQRADRPVRGSDMPSFDVVSQVDLQEVDNALNQTRKEIGQRYDFKGTKTEHRGRQGKHPHRLRRRLQGEGRRRRAAVEARAARHLAEGARLRQDRAGRRRPRQADDHRAAGHRHRQGAPDRQADQGHQAQGAGADPGRSGARHRQEARRSAGGDPAAQGSRISTCRCSSSTSASRACGRRHFYGPLPVGLAAVESLLQIRQAASA